MQPAVVQLEERRSRAQAAAEGRRLDLYTPVHKGIRAFLGATLHAAGRLDVNDPEDVAATLAEVRGLFGFLRSHLHHENQFMHPALETRHPGSARQTAHEHVEHERALENLEGLALALERGEPAGRARAAAELYRALAIFAAENLAHMDVEETANNAQLWAAYDDAELARIHEALLAAIPPAEMALGLRWMLPAMTPTERAALLTEMQGKLPAPAFAGLLAQLRPNLLERDWAKLTAALGPVV
jgi:hypothetical protein